MHKHANQNFKIQNNVQKLILNMQENAKYNANIMQNKCKCATKYAKKCKMTT